MGISLADDRRIDVHHLPLHFHAVDRNRNTMRDFFIQAVKRFLADQLRHNLALRLVCDRVLIIELRTVRKVFQNHFNKLIRIVSAPCRHRHDIREVIFLPVCINSRKQILFLHHINLVDHKDDRRLYSLKLIDDVPFSGSDKRGRLHKPEHHIHFIQRALGYIYHIFAKLVLRLVDPRRINKHDLAVLRCKNGLDTVPRCLRFIRCDRDLLSDQMVHQGRLSYVRSADQSDKTGFKIIFHTYSSSLGT